MSARAVEVAGPDPVLEFWFTHCGPEGLPSQHAVKQWFSGGRAFDELCRERFADHVTSALAGELEAWSATPRGRLALVLLLDQLPRNLFRGGPEAFAGDGEALRHAATAVDRGEDERLLPVERYFLYMPFEHAEDLACQDFAVALFEALAQLTHDYGGTFFAGGIEWARRHRAVIERFGRFPARNRALGRDTTPAEAAFLEEHPAGF